jgi:opacity protein-like surface antigen
MKSYRFTAGFSLSVCVVATLLPLASYADDSNEWRFQITPYLWMAGLEGKVKPVRASPTLNVNKSFSEILDNVDAAMFLTGTARYGRYIVHGDFSHVVTSDSASLPMNVSARAKVRQTSMTLTGGYSWSLGQASNVDLMAGMRAWKINAKAQVSVLGSARSDTSFVDPIIAARWRYDINPRWSTLLYMDVGGFGVGSDSTWQVMGAVNYQLARNTHLSLGYRELSVDYDAKGKRLDFRQGGPLVGVTFTF